MIDLYRQMLEEVMFPPESPRSLVLVAGFIEPDPSGVADDSGAFALPRHLFPGSCVVQDLPSNTGFIAGLHEAIVCNSPHAVVPRPALPGRQAPPALTCKPGIPG